MGKQVSTTENELGPQSSAAKNILPQLEQLARQAGLELGDLSDIASGNVSATAQDRELVEQSTGVAGDIARRNSERNYRMARTQTEDALLGRGVDDATVAAITQAIQGGQYQTELANINSTQQGQTAQGLLQLPFQKAETQISANRAILERILGASTGALNYDIQERLGGATQTQATPFNWAGAAQGVGQTAAAFAK